MHPLFPARRAWSGSEHVFWVGFTGTASILSLGAIPVFYGWRLRERRRKYDDLFRLGSFTTGTIRSVPAQAGGMYTLIKYEFEVGGVSYVDHMHHPTEMTRYWSASDTVSILYDPGDPSRSCIVYR